MPARRRGGREARRELRARPIPTEAMAVRPGLVGGRYRPFTATEVERIHRAPLDVLEPGNGR
jgi:trimethylamine--corrinoid protein Co-methyltransferase